MSALVRIEEDRVVADSRDVAADFGKQHVHVLRSIDEKLKIKPELASNFGCKFYEIKTGNGGKRSSRCFDMDRKGFMLLVMGFTGKKALEIQSRWIDAFDQMEQRLCVLMQAQNDDGDDAVAVAEVENGLPPLPEDFRERLRYVSEARLLGGKDAGRRAWRGMGFPDVFVPEALMKGFTATHNTLSESARAAGVAEWARERLLPSEGMKARLGVFFADFDDWHRTARGGGAPISLVSFGKAMRSLGLHTYRCNGSWLSGYMLSG